MDALMNRLQMWQITVTSHCTIRIENILEATGQASTPLPSIYDSVGFGLDIVETILEAHDSVLDCIKSDTQFNARFRLISA